MHLHCLPSRSDVLIDSVVYISESAGSERFSSVATKKKSASVCTHAISLKNTNNKMPAGVAFDGSVWVTAGSSIGLGT